MDTSKSQFHWIRIWKDIERQLDDNGDDNDNNDNDYDYDGDDNDNFIGLLSSTEVNTAITGEV
jgi:hypothetical protein